MFTAKSWFSDIKSQPKPADLKVVERATHEIENRIIDVNTTRTELATINKQI